mmetsp:Transcript_14023/g.19303  ORF Transcript_14023/g.19303 Transcript_14023/m.19303 type:complete len:80 (+) Transcript_14023:239-478(+)
MVVSAEVGEDVVGEDVGEDVEEDVGEDVGGLGGEVSSTWYRVITDVVVTAEAAKDELSLNMEAGLEFRRLTKSLAPASA